MAIIKVQMIVKMIIKSAEQISTVIMPLNPCCPMPPRENSNPMISMKNNRLNKSGKAFSLNIYCCLTLSLVDICVKDMVDTSFSYCSLFYYLSRHDMRFIYTDIF